MDRILEVRSAALRRAAELLGVEIPAGLQVQLYLYPTKDEKHEDTGVADSVHSLPSRNALHMTAAVAARPSPQEEIHLLAKHASGGRRGDAARRADAACRWLHSATLPDPGGGSAVYSP